MIDTHTLLKVNCEKQCCVADFGLQVSSICKASLFVTHLTYRVRGGFCGLIHRDIISLMPLYTWQIGTEIRGNA